MCTFASHFYKNVTSIVVFRLLLGLLVFATIASAQAQNEGPTLSPRYAERLLSDHYESIAKNSLKDVLPSDKYKLLIDVRLEDAEELKQISKDKTYAPLPGTISNNPDFSQSLFIGQLESLTQKRSVLLILDPAYEASLGEGANLKELAQETLTGKLKLNLAAGSDSINIRNLVIMGDSQKRMPASLDASKNSFDVIQFLSWCLAAFCFLGLGFMFFRKIRSDKTEDAAAAATPNAMNTPSEIAALTGGEVPEFKEVDLFDEEEKDPDALTPPPHHNVNIADAPISPSLLILPTSPIAKELTDKLSNIVKEYPKLTSEALQSFLDQHHDKTYRVGYLVELLGFEESLMLFKGVSQKHWKIIGHYMAEYPVSNSNPIDLEEAAMLYRYLVARIVEHKGLESDMGVFAIEGYSANDLSKAIDSEGDQFAAQFISGISDAMAQDILNAMPTNRRANVLTVLSSIDKLDPETINFIETTIQQRLSEDGIKPITISNEARIFTSLGNLPAHEEESLFAQMAQSDPGIIFRSKRHRLYQEHLEHVREDVLSDELRSYPIESLSQMLKGMAPAVRDHVIACLTEKKAMVVQDMLSTLETQPKGPEFAESRREFLDFLYEKYAQGGGVFIDNIFKTSSGSSAAAA